MEGAGKGNGKEAALGETLVSPYINPTSQSAYPVWILPTTLTNSFSLGIVKPYIIFRYRGMVLLVLLNT